MLFLIVVVGILAVVALNQISSLRRNVEDLNGRIGKVHDKLILLERKFIANRFGRLHNRLSELEQRLPPPAGPGTEPLQGLGLTPAVGRSLKSPPATRVASMEATPESPLVEAQETERTDPPLVESPGEPPAEEDALALEPAVLDGYAKIDEEARQQVQVAGEADQVGTSDGDDSVPDEMEGIGFEAKLGTVWTMRIGLGLLAIAAAYYARAILPTLSPAWKVALAYAGAAALFSVGKVFEQRLTVFAKPVMAGGLSLGFFVSYAAHFVLPMQAVSLPVSLAWMAAGVVAILMFAERWRSQPMAALAVVLGHTSALVAAGSADSFSLVIITALSIIAVVLLVRHDWAELALFAVITSYSSHLLWSFADHVSVTAVRAFWMNVAFFASYYVAFLIGDLVWWRRVVRQTSWEHRRYQQLAGRLIGPVNVTLFLSVVSYLYVATDVFLTDIHWFFFVLAAVQEAHGRYLMMLENDDYVFYPTVGIVLVTLGFFSAFGALSLNLVLAAEALVLLVLAHRTRVWLFHLLAQAVLAANFVHSWIYADNVVATVPVFLGTVAVAAVYMVQSWLEERWYGRVGDPDWEMPRGSVQLPFGSVSRGLAEVFDDIYSDVTPYLPAVHAGAGALILVHHSVRWLSVPNALVVVSGALILLLAAGLVLRSVPFLVGYLVLQIGIAYIAIAGLPSPDWVSWPVLTACFLCALVLTTVAPWRLHEGSDKKTAMWLSHAAIWGAVAASLAAAFASSFDGMLSLLWIATLAVLFAQQDRVSAVVKTLELEDDPLKAADELSGGIACVFGGILLVGWTWRVVDAFELRTDFALPVLLVLWGGALIAAGGIRRRVRIYVGGATVFLICYLLIATFASQLTESTWATLWVVAVTLGIAVAQDLQLATESPTTRLPRAATFATYTAYVLGLALLFALFETRFGFPWSVVAMAVLPFALVALNWRYGAERAAWVALLSLWLMLVAIGVGVYSDIASTSGSFLLPAFLFSAFVVAFERVLTTNAGLPRIGEDADPNPSARLLLIAGVAAVAMVVVYKSTTIIGGWVTASWSIVGAVLMILGFLWKSANYRRVALVALAVCLARVFLLDVRNLTDEAKVLAFATLGVCLIAVAWLYSRYSGDFKKWL